MYVTRPDTLTDAARARRSTMLLWLYLNARLLPPGRRVTALRIWPLAGPHHHWQPPSPRRLLRGRQCPRPSGENVAARRSPYPWPENSDEAFVACATGERTLLRARPTVAQRPRVLIRDASQSDRQLVGTADEPDQLRRAGGPMVRDGSQRITIRHLARVNVCTAAVWPGCDEEGDLPAPDGSRASEGAFQSPGRRSLTRTGDCPGFHTTYFERRAGSGDGQVSRGFAHRLTNTVSRAGRIDDPEF